MSYSGLRADGHYQAACQELTLAWAGSVAHAHWMVDPALTAQRVQVELTWPGLELRSDGRRLTRNSAPMDMPCPPMSWRQATQRGLAAFLDAVDGHADLARHAQLALATVRLGSSPTSQPSIASG